MSPDLGPYCLQSSSADDKPDDMCLELLDFFFF